MKTTGAEPFEELIKELGLSAEEANKYLETTFPDSRSRGRTEKGVFYLFRRPVGALRSFAYVKTLPYLPKDPEKPLRPPVELFIFRLPPNPRLVEVFEVSNKEKRGRMVVPPNRNLRQRGKSILGIDLGDNLYLYYPG